MEKKDMIKLQLVFFFSLVFILAGVKAAPVIPSYCDWVGTVTIGSNASTNGAVVTAHVNASTTISATDVVGTPDSGYYLIHVPASAGDNITFKVNGVLAYPTNDTPQTWVAGGSKSLNLNMTPLANGQACLYAGGCSGGYCVHSYCRAASTYCGDSACDSGESCTSCASDCGSCGGGGSVTGSGGGAASTQPTVTVIEETKEAGTFEEGEEKAVTFAKEDSHSVQEILIASNTAVENAVTVKVSVLESKPSDIPVPAGEVFTYLNITTKNIEEDAIDNASIKFKLNQTWISANNIDKNTVKLKRFTTSWETLETSLVKEDGKFAYYQAKTPGFSVFAVTAEKITAAVCTPSLKKCEGNDLQQCNSEGTGWSTLESCANGCDSANLTCKSSATPTQVCTPASKKCEGSSIQQCNSEGTGWSTLESCPYGCDADSKTCKAGPEPKPAFDPAVLIIIGIIIVVIIIIAFLIFANKKENTQKRLF